MIFVPFEGENQMNGHQRQREQSRRMIEEALFELMGEKAFAQITVSEIVNRADVARRTFYRLYQGKEEILRNYIHRLCRDYLGGCAPLKRYDIAQIAREYFSFWYRYKDFLLLMHGSGMDEMLYYEISRASGAVVKGRIDEEVLKEDRGLSYFADYSAGGFLLLLGRWIAEGMAQPPEQYAEAVSRAILKFMEK